MSRFLQWLFFCRHERMSWPQTPKGWEIKAALVTGTYIVCLDCGEEFPYSWREMAVVSESKIHLVPSREKREKVSV